MPVSGTAEELIRFGIRLLVIRHSAHFSLDRPTVRLKHWWGGNSLPHLTFVLDFLMSNYKLISKGFVINYQCRGDDDVQQNGSKYGWVKLLRGSWILQFDLSNLSPLQNQHYSIIWELWTLDRISLFISRGFSCWPVQSTKTQMSLSLPLSRSHTHTYTHTTRAL